jgi:2'-5' RNA ligase
VPTAISIKAVNPTADRIVALWADASRFEDAPSMAALLYPPHITLAVYDEVDLDRAQLALATTFQGQEAFHIRIERLRYFNGPPLVLWAAPSASPELSRAHSRVHDLIDPALCRPHYRPEIWVPHCTVAMNVSNGRRDEAVVFADRVIEPFDLVLDYADLVAFPPVSVLTELALAAPRSGTAE